MFERIREGIRGIFNGLGGLLYNQMYVDASNVLRKQLATAAKTGDRKVYRDFLTSYGGTVMEPLRLSELRHNAVEAGDTISLRNLLSWDNEYGSKRYADTLRQLVGHALPPKGNPDTLGFLLGCPGLDRDDVTVSMERLYRQNLDRSEEFRPYEEVLSYHGFDVKGMKAQAAADAEEMRQRRENFMPVPWAERKRLADEERRAQGGQPPQPPGGTGP